MRIAGLLMDTRPCLGRRTRPQKRLSGQRPAAQNALPVKASARQRDCAIGGPQKSVLDHGIAAAMLGGVEGGIGSLDQVGRALALVRLGAGEADADGDGLIAARGMRNCELLHLGAYHLTDLESPRSAGVRQQQAEFLATIARGKA